MFYTSALNTPKSPDLDLNCIEREEGGVEEGMRRGESG